MALPMALWVEMHFGDGARNFCAQKMNYYFLLDNFMEILQFRAYYWQIRVKKYLVKFTIFEVYKSIRHFLLTIRISTLKDKNETLKENV